MGTPKQQAGNGSAETATTDEQSGDGIVRSVEGALVLSLDDLDKIEDVRYDHVTVPHWSKPGQAATIRIGSLNADDMIEFVESNEGPARRTASLRLIIKSIVDEKGVRTGRPEHLKTLRGKDASMCNKVVEAILLLNGIGAKAQEASKNGSGEVVSGASPTVSA